MIDKVIIDGFKCFDHAELKMGNLTLLAGKNSAGKSTVIQAILAMEQTGKNPFSGQYIKLGKISELKNQLTGNKEIKITICCKTEKEQRTATKILKDDYTDAEVIGQFIDSMRIHYLIADRKGVDDTYEKLDDNQDEIGVDCKYAFSYLAKHERDSFVDSEMVYDWDSKLIFGGQVEYWLERLVGYRVKAEEIPHTEKILVTYEKGRIKNLRPKNVGTGVTYITELIIAALSCKRGDVLIMENPEIHLHPSGQAEFIEFVAFLVGKGIQVIIETHSDHIYNGIRKSVYLDYIEQTDVQIYFLEQQEDGTSKPVLIPVDEQGKVMVHQEDMFDQTKKDLNVLIGW